jgi:hypothetical protein
MSMDRLNRKCLAVIVFLLVFAALLLSIPSQRVPHRLVARNSCSPIHFTYSVCITPLEERITLRGTGNELAKRFQRKQQLSALCFSRGVAP